MESLCIFVCLALHLINILLNCLLWGCYKGEGKLWRDTEMSGIGVCDVKFPKINKMNHVEKAKDLEILCSHVLLSIAYIEIQTFQLTERQTFWAMLYIT